MAGCFGTETPIPLLGKGHSLEKKIRRSPFADPVPNLTDFTHSTSRPSRAFFSSTILAADRPKATWLHGRSSHKAISSPETLRRTFNGSTGTFHFEWTRSNTQEPCRCHRKVDSCSICLVKPMLRPRSCCDLRQVAHPSLVLSAFS